MPEAAAEAAPPRVDRTACFNSPRSAYHEKAPPTNNHAERMIKPIVVAGKAQGCNKSQAGADAHAILGSILVTEKQGKRR